MNILEAIEAPVDLRGEEPVALRAAFLSVITPAYNESRNLPHLYQRLRAALDSLGIQWEWIIVDDHSPDRTFQVMEEIAKNDDRVSGLRLARNFGAHTAFACGVHHAHGDCAIFLAADLQDPPESIEALLRPWQAGAQVVWAARAKREGEKASTVGFARVYYWIMRHVVGIRDMPSSGADFFLIDRRVIDAFRQFRETNLSVMTLITWMGFRQVTIFYDKQARLHGSSGWSLSKKIKLVIDSVTSFSYLPIRVMSCAGFITALFGFAYAAFIFFHYLTGAPIQGWSSLMIAVLVLGGGQMLMMGILGEYLWRALDESRQRPRYLIEDNVGLATRSGVEQPDMQRAARASS